MSGVVIFDGVCSLCARSVKFILEHEASPVLRFTPLQSRAGSRLLRELGFDPAEANTFVLVADGKAYVKGCAILVASTAGVRRLSRNKNHPRPISDRMYFDVVARKDIVGSAALKSMEPSPDSGPGSEESEAAFRKRCLTKCSVIQPRRGRDTWKFLD